MYQSIDKQPSFCDFSCAVLVAFQQQLQARALPSFDDTFRYDLAGEFDARNSVLMMVRAAPLRSRFFVCDSSLQQLPDLQWRQRHVQVAHAMPGKCVDGGVDQCRGGADGAGFAGSFDTQRISR